MENNITTLPVEGNRQTAKRNPLARFFSAANRKRKQIITSVTTMVTMAMATAVSAFAEGNGEGGVVDGEAAFNEVESDFSPLGLDVSVLWLRLSAA